MTIRSVILFLSITLVFVKTIYAAQVETPVELSFLSRLTSYFSAPTAIEATPTETPQGPSLDESPQTSPPVWLFYQRFCATIGLDPQIKITPMQKIDSGLYFLKVSFLGENTKKADALAILFTKKREIGGAIVDTIIYDLNGEIIKPQPFPSKISEAMILLKTALENNPLFRAIKAGNPYYDFFVEFAFILVQYAADKQDDYYGNINESAAYAFLNSLDLGNIEVLKIGTTTEPVELAYEIATKPSGVRVYIPKKLEMKTDAGNW